MDRPSGKNSVDSGAEEDGVEMGTGASWPSRGVRQSAPAAGDRLASGALLDPSKSSGCQMQLDNFYKQVSFTTLLPFAPSLTYSFIHSSTYLLIGCLIYSF